MKWFNCDKAVVTEKTIELEQPKGVEFKSDNLSTKLPYDIIINGFDTGHKIIFIKGKWTLMLGLILSPYFNMSKMHDVAYLSQDSISTILLKISQLNMELL